MKGVVEVSAGLIFREGRLLITQRHPEAHLGGLWEFPGGKREAEETDEQCLARELREELAVDAAVGELVADITHAYPDKTVRLKFFVCRLLAGEPKPVGCAALEWTDRAGLAGYEFPAADGQLLDLLQNPRFWK